MSSNSVTEKEGSKDNYYVQTVNMDATPAPAPQMQPFQRTYGNPVRLPCSSDSMSTALNWLSGTFRHAGLWYRLPVLVNIDPRRQASWCIQLGLGFRHLVSFCYSQIIMVVTWSFPAMAVSRKLLWACGRCSLGMVLTSIWRATADIFP